jgi:hypothetical protein
MGATVEFENERVKVLRVKHGQREGHPQTSRNDRLVIYLNQGHIKRTESGKQEEIKRKPGDVVWRGRSQHQVENLSDANHEVIIVELKK